MKYVKFELNVTGWENGARLLDRLRIKIKQYQGSPIAITGYFPHSIKDCAYSKENKLYKAMVPCSNVQRRLPRTICDGSSRSVLH